MKKPVISINIPCHNRSAMLRECIDLFIKQTFTDWDLVVVDDGSTEDLTFVTEMDDRIKYFRQERFGMAKAYNLALKNSKGKYIMPFGSDDLATDETLLEDVLNHLESDLTYDVVYTDYWLLRLDGGRLRRKSFKALDDDSAYESMLVRQYMAHPGSLWKKEKMPMYDESLTSAVDWELFLTAMENGVRFNHRAKRLWTYRVGHEREGKTVKQNANCDIVLGRRGCKFDRSKRMGVKI